MGAQAAWKGFSLFLCFSPVLHRGNSVLLFEYILEIRLVGKTQIAADFRKALIAVGQKAFSFFHLTSCYESTDVDAEFFLKTSHYMGAASVYLFCNIINADGFIGMAADIIHTLVDLRGNPIRYMCLTGSLAEIN